MSEREVREATFRVGAMCRMLAFVRVRWSYVSFGLAGQLGGLEQF